jgi:flagellar basal-body rod protein FlgB
MAISFDKALGIHEQALNVRTTRARLIANNLANADTPNFKARDIDFREILNSASRNNNANELTMTKTRANHQGGLANMNNVSVFSKDVALLYRNPTQPSIDGNTVDEHVEHSEFMENALAFQASFTLLNKKFMGLKTAIRGE